MVLQMGEKCPACKQAHLAGFGAPFTAVGAAALRQGASRSRYGYRA
jgi:hypothetical protein